MNRKKFSFLLAFATLLFTGQSFAQQAYYWADGETAELVEDHTGIALHFQIGALPANL